MGQSLFYLEDAYWATEGAAWRSPAPITLRDYAGAVLGSSKITTLVLTLYDLMSPPYAIIGEPPVEQVNIKNVRGCTLDSQGTLVVTLQPGDTVILDPTHAYEHRRALIEYEWLVSAVTYADAVELTVVIRNVQRRPYVAPVP